MHSKLKIWDYLKTYPQGLPTSGKVVAISCYDTFSLKFLRKYFKTESMHEGKMNILLGHEVSTSWVDDNFRSLGLFGNEESFLIHGAEELNEAVQESLELVDELLLDGRFLILNFHKDCKFFKRLQKSKSEKVETIQITAPAFWEEKQLLDFLCGEFDLTLSREVQESIQSKVSFDIASYSQFLEQLSLNFLKGEKISNLKEVHSLMNESKLDQFEILELFATKKMKLFYQKLLNAIQSGNEIIPLLYLMQGHFIKLYDTSYLEGKAKLTKYDRGIQSQAKLWSEKDLVKVTSYLGEVLVLAKQKNIELERRSKQEQLRLIKF